MRLLLTLLLVSFPMVASASSTMRCGDTLISVGAPTAQVLLACGEPLTREDVGVEAAGTEAQLVQRWTYDLGPGRFLRILEFKGGVLASIEDGPRQ